MSEKIGAAWVRKLEACVVARRVIFLNSEPETSHRVAERHNAKTRH